MGKDQDGPDRRWRGHSQGRPAFSPGAISASGRDPARRDELGGMSADRILGSHCHRAGSEETHLAFLAGV